MCCAVLCCAVLCCAVLCCAVLCCVLQERALETVGTLLADPICSNNPHVLLIAGIIYSQEENYVEALKACHSGASLEM
jgi:hypothetical protein